MKSPNLSCNYEAARWIALYHGINRIAEVAEAKEINWDEMRIDQPALYKYVDEISDDILHVIETDDTNEL